MSNFEWIKASRVEKDDTIRIAGYDLVVTDVRRGSEKVYVTTEKGHNGKPSQVYALESSQEVEVSK